MADPLTGAVEWFNPDPRAVFPLAPRDAFHVPASLARVVRSGRLIGGGVDESAGDDLFAS